MYLVAWENERWTKWLGKFFLGGGGKFFKIVQALSAVYLWPSALTKKPMLAYGKNMPRNNQFSVFCPEKIKYHPEKNMPKFLKNLPKK